MKSLMDAKEQRGDGKTSSRGGTGSATGLHLLGGLPALSSLYIPALLHRNPFKDHLRQDTSLINSAHCIPSSEVGSFHATLLGAG